MPDSDCSIQIEFCYEKKTSIGPKRSFHFNSHVILVMQLSYGNHTATAKSCLTDWDSAQPHLQRSGSRHGITSLAFLPGSRGWWSHWPPCRTEWITKLSVSLRQAKATFGSSVHYLWKPGRLVIVDICEYYVSSNPFLKMCTVGMTQIQLSSLQVLGWYLCARLTTNLPVEKY